MAKLQIFVLLVALTQVYGRIDLSNIPTLLPALIEPEVPTVVTPPCVSSIRAILEAILARLPDIEQPRPLPVDPVDPEVPENTVPELETEEEEADVPQVELETPCTACFQYINSLLTSAEKVLEVRKLSQALYLRR